MSRNQVGHPNGDQLIKVHKDEIRALGLMPRDVEVLGFMTPQEAGVLHWNDEARDYCFVHIKSTISFDRSPKAALTIEDLMAFYERYISIRKGWANDLEQDLGFYGQTGLLPHWITK